MKYLLNKRAACLFVGETQCDTNAKGLLLDWILTDRLYAVLSAF